MRKRDEQPEDTFADAAAPARLTPMDVQQKEFGVTRVGGGYRMRDVDEFLDQLTNSMTSLVEENRRLKEQAGSGAMIGAPDLEQVSRQADEIIRRARDEAGQILREAHGAPAGTAAPPDAATTDASRAAISPFLLREREFLQSLAGLVQGHAEAVKGMAKDARSASSAPPSAVREVTEADPAVREVTEAGPAVRKIPEAGPAVAQISEATSSVAERPETSPAVAAPEPVREEPTAPAVRADRAEPEPMPPAHRDPDLGADDEGSAAATAGPATEAMEEPVRIDEPEPATVGRVDPDEGAEEGDRSLRDLFWGEE